MHKNYLAIAAFFGGLAVALGAFGAHGLQKITSDAAILHSYNTGVQYQMYHSLGLLAVAILFEKFSSRWLRWVANCFITGIILFSGSLYLLTVLKIQDVSTKWVGPITPAGGLFFIAGWLLLLIAVTRKNS
ncbi:MAG: DUF423 domain-containing protein [Chitinophagaceae bacterium]|nr:DUF423 domain-containing protein [Chitinophagaceae bacterium]